MALVYTTKDAILTALETCLKRVSWVTTVDRQQVGVQEYQSPKGCFISDVRETRRTFLKNCILVDYTVMVVVFVYVEAQTSLSTEMNAALQEVKAQLVLDTTLGGLVDKVIINSIDTDSGFNAPNAYATLVLSIQYLGAT